MKKYKGLLLDLDGTMYRGNEVIQEAPFFVEECRKRGIPYVFLTNNSSKQPVQVADKLNGMGIHALPEQVYTSSMAAAAYIQRKFSEPNVFMIGEEGLESALLAGGATLTEENADVVVVGIDRELSYDKLRKAALNIQNGAAFVSTNKDRAIPTEEGMLPGNGAVTEAIALTAGISPVYVGKPEALIVEEALEVLGVSKEEALLVGDNYETDISAGIYAGVDTLMVETGATSFEDLNEVESQPTYKVKKLDEWTFS
ncbi:TIGR01457 family HAD-type hydrolase [Salimicrobium humidisoli]|uniref:TIGR01457 family HAD-type hydrolase n=1 Tax=Salimicrobium humidisoli TaxID=2029857 RepID=A0ABX4HSU2_9BACI|nr:TIGR01457 family HAD-type hydrolase [Salimicrobium humidisoli]PBB06291.1 TIGR01457 family HAD-type hydrolase [Salimicrobium humidisoli]